jgi:hypothetical protein
VLYNSACEQQAVAMLHVVAYTHICLNLLLIKGVQPAHQPWHAWWPCVLILYIDRHAKLGNDWHCQRCSNESEHHDDANSCSDNQVTLAIDVGKVGCCSKGHCASQACKPQHKLVVLADRVQAVEVQSVAM